MLQRKKTEIATKCLFVCLTFVVGEEHQQRQENALVGGRFFIFKFMLSDTIASMLLHIYLLSPM